MRVRIWVVAIAAGTCLAQDTLKLSLKDAEQTALRNNPRVPAAQFLAAAAHQVPRELRAAYQPTVFGSVTTVGAADGTRLAAGALNNPIIYSRFASGAGVSQIVTDFGRTGSLVASASSQALAQDENTKTSRADVLLAVDRAYFAVLRAEAVLKVARQTVAARQLVADQIQALASNKLKSSLDVSFANVNLAEARLLLASARNDVKASSAQLAAALGLPAQRDFDLAGEPLPPAPPDRVDPLLDEAIRNRPELASLRLQRQAAEQFTRAERALAFPAISSVANLGLAPAAVEQIQNRYGAVGLNVTIPIFNGGLFAARRAEAEARARSVAENVRDLQNRIIRDVQMAWLDASTGYERLSLTGKLLEQARLALDLAQSRYDLGLSSIVELSQAQLNLTSAQIASSSAGYEYQAQWSGLQYQIGALR